MLAEVRGRDDNLGVRNVVVGKESWTKKSILNALRTGKFSSDRTIHEYAQQIWKINHMKVTEELE